jgi:hypothetical protein
MTVSRGVVVMCAAQACAQIGAFSVAAVLPTLIGAWSLSNTEAGWISGIYYAAYTAVVAFVWLRPADLAGDGTAVAAPTPRRALES